MQNIYVNMFNSEPKSAKNFCIRAGGITEEIEHLLVDSPAHGDFSQKAQVGISGKRNQNSGCEGIGHYFRRPAISLLHREEGHRKGPQTKNCQRDQQESI